MRYKDIGIGKSTQEQFYKEECNIIVNYGQNKFFNNGLRNIKFGKYKETRKNLQNKLKLRFNLFQQITSKKLKHYARNLKMQMLKLHR